MLTPPLVHVGAMGPQPHCASVEGRRGGEGGEGGAEGGKTWQRGPQSRQSVPNSHHEYCELAPPSSQTVLLSDMGGPPTQVLRHMQVVGVALMAAAKGRALFAEATKEFGRGTLAPSSGTFKLTAFN